MFPRQTGSRKSATPHRGSEELSRASESFRFSRQSACAIPVQFRLSNTRLDSATKFRRVPRGHWLIMTIRTATFPGIIRSWMRKRPGHLHQCCLEPRWATSAEEKLSRHSPGHRSSSSGHSYMGESGEIVPDSSSTTAAHQLSILFDPSAVAGGGRFLRMLVWCG